MINFQILSNDQLSNVVGGSTANEYGLINIDTGGNIGDIGSLGATAPAGSLPAPSAPSLVAVGSGSASPISTSITPSS